MPPELRKRPEPGSETEAAADQPTLVDPGSTENSGLGDGGDNSGGGYSPLNSTKKEVSTSSSSSFILKCPICDCAFLNKSDLRSHYRRHPGVDKPFRCTFPKCTNTEWALKTKLTRHICAKHLRKPNEISLAKASKYIVFLKDVYEAETATLGLGAEEALPSTKANRPSMRYCDSSAVLLPDSQQTLEEMAAAAAVAAAISSAAKAAAEKALSPAGNADDANSKESDETEEEDNENSEDKDDESEEKDKTEDKDKEEEEESDEVEFLSEQPFSVVHQVATSGNYLCPGRGCPHQTAELAKLKVHYRKRHAPADHRPYRCCFNAGRCAFAADQLIKVKRHIRVSHLREIDDDLVEKDTAENMADKDDDLEEDLAISTDGGSEFSCIEVDTSLEDRLFGQAKVVQLTVPPLPVRPPPQEKPTASNASKLIFKPLPPTFFHQALQLRPTISTEGALPVKPKMPPSAKALQKRKRRKAKMYLPFACPYRSCEAAFSTLQKLRLHFGNSTAHRNTARKPFYCTYSVDCKMQNACKEAVLEHIAERHFGVPAEQMANQTEDERFRNERYLGVRKNILKRELEAAEARAAEQREARLKAEQELAAMTREKYRKGVYDSLATIWNRKG